MKNNEVDYESYEKNRTIDVSSEFISLGDSDFRRFLRQKIKENIGITFTIAIDWVSKWNARKAKGYLEDSALNIKSITIRATRKQYEEDVNAFESGVKWEEVAES